LNALRRTFLCSFFAIATLVLPAQSQVVVQEGVSTDTVDLFAKQSSKHQKSTVLAMCASILLPGLGHQYLGDYNKAIGYYSAEALFIFGALFCNHYSNVVSDNSKVFAWEHAEVSGGPGANSAYWQNVGLYDDSKSFNETMERTYRSEVNDYLTPNLQWRWDDTGNRNIYNSMIQESLSWEVASSFFLGAMVLNRLVAFIDARLTAREMETHSLSSLQFMPRYDPISRAAGLTLRAGF